jgi:hypothetical protein
MQTVKINYFVGILVGVLVGFLAVHMLLISLKEYRWHPDAQYIGAWYDKKGQIANSIQAQKIIFAGGSNVQYGIRAGLVQEKLGISSVNFGTHGALPFAYIIEQVKKIAKPGDTIVLIPEYEHYFLDPNALNPTSLRYLSVCGQDFLKKFPKKYFELLLTIPPEILFARLFVDSKKVASEVQSIAQEHESTFDQFGDRNLISKERMGDREKRLIESVHPTSLADPFSDKHAPFPESELKNFQAWCQNKGVQLFITFPNTIHFDEYDKPDTQKFLSSLQDFLKLNKIKSLLNPSDSMLPREDFFDTVYHLNEEGAIKRTSKLIDTLNIKNNK